MTPEKDHTMSSPTSAPASIGGDAVAGTPFEALTPGTWNIDPSHSTVGFIARHLVVTKVRGRFGAFTGSIEIAPELLDSKVTASIDVTSLTTGDEGRDTHLKSPDFFDVEQHPTMTFTTSAVRRSGADLVLVGELTIGGVARPVELDLVFEGVQQDPWGGTRAGFSASADVSRKDWGLEWNVALEAGGVLVGDKVRLELDIQAVRA
jgi:polyisoprenoid-binding protein YceI